MPLYEYQCQHCGEVFSHLWRTMRAAEAGELPLCPHCQSAETRRLVSQVAVLGELGGMTPGEQRAANAQAARMASITPKAQIDKLRTGKKKAGGK